MSKYARGSRAWGICGRSGIKMLLENMIFDGRYPNMRVHPDWWEPKDPLDYAPRVDDPVALWRPAPDNWILTPPVLTLDDFDSTTASLSWTASISDAYQTTQYQLFYRPAGSEIDWIADEIFLIERDMYGAITVEPLDTVFTLPVTDALYEFLIIASDSGGKSAWSNIVTMAAPIEYGFDEAFDSVLTLLASTLLDPYSYLTSRIYPIELIDAIDTALELLASPQYLEAEALDSVMTFIDGTLSTGLVTYALWPTEAFDSVLTLLSGGTLANGLVSYGNYAAEAFDADLTLQSGTLIDGLVAYNNYPAEALDSSLTFQSGTLA